MSFEALIYGEPASKANSRKMVLIGGKPRFIKSKKAREYVEGFQKQCHNDFVVLYASHGKLIGL